MEGVTCSTISNNYNLSLKILVGLLRWLRHNPEILHQYDALTREQIRRGNVEPADPKTP